MIKNNMIFFAQDDGQSGEGSEPEKKIVKFQGLNGMHEIPEEIYTDLTARFNGEKSRLQSQYQKELDEFKTKFTEVDTQLTELKKSAMTDKERQEHEKNEKEKLIADALNKADTNYKLYSEALINAEMSRIIAKYRDKLVSPQHMNAIIKHTLKPVLKDNKVYSGDAELESAFNEFLKVDDNKTLLRSSLGAGAGTTQKTNGTAGSPSNYRREDIAKNPAIRQEYAAKLKAGENPTLS